MSVINDVSPLSHGPLSDLIDIVWLVRAETLLVMLYMMWEEVEVTAKLGM